MEKIVGFLIETEKLKAVLRKTKPLGEDRYENSAEHSWQTTLAAMVLLEAAPSGTDALKVLKMLLIHDIVEIDAGDVFVYDDQARKEAYAAEVAAAERIFHLLDEPLASELLALWHEFEEGVSPESKFAKAADRIMPVLQNLSAGGQSWTENNITRAQVLAKNEPIAQASPELWAWVKRSIEEAQFLKD